MTKEQYTECRNAAIMLLIQMEGIGNEMEEGRYLEGERLWYLKIDWDEHIYRNAKDWHIRHIAHIEFDEDTEYADAGRQIKEAWEALRKEL